MGNTLQPRPADATAATFVQPDWNSKFGTGVAPTPVTNLNFTTLYTAAQAGEAERLTHKLPRDPGL